MDTKVGLLYSEAGPKLEAESGVIGGGDSIRGLCGPLTPCVLGTRHLLRFHPTLHSKPVKYACYPPSDKEAGASGAYVPQT